MVLRPVGAFRLLGLTLFMFITMRYSRRTVRKAGGRVVRRLK